MPPVGRTCDGPGGVVAHGDRRVVAEEDRAGVRQRSGRAGRGRRSRRAGARGRSGSRADGLVLVADQDQGPEPFEAVAGQVAAAQPGELVVEGLGDAVDQVGLPGDQDARARRVLGLADQVGGDVARVGRPVGDQDDLARPGDAVDVDLAVDLPLGQGDEQVARARRSCRPARSPRPRRPGPPRPGRRRSGRPRSRPGHGRRPAGRRCSRRTRGRDDHGDLRRLPPPARGRPSSAATTDTPPPRPGCRRRPGAGAVAQAQLAARPALDPWRRGCRMPDWNARMLSRTPPGVFKIGRIGGPVGGLELARRRREPTPARASRRRAAGVVEHGRRPRHATSAQIRSTTCWGVSGSPKAAIVRARPWGLTTLPRG